VIYEIVNPSDHYTIACEDERIACAATLLLGDGKYGLSVDGASVMPVFLFGGGLEWWAEKFTEPLETVLGRRGEIAICLRSVVIGDRTSFEAAIAAIDDAGKRAGFVETWNDRHRSSTNDIGAHALHLAEQLEKPKGAQP